MQKKKQLRSTRNIKRPTNLKKLGVAVIIILLLGVVAGTLAYRYWHSTSKSKSAVSGSTSNINYTPAPPADNSANENRKSSPTPSSTLNTTGNNTSPNSAPSAPNFTVQIVSHSVSNGNLHIGTLVNGIISGSCTVSASKSGQAAVVLATSSVIQDVNTYDCGSLNVATSKFSSSGDWQLTVTVSNSGVTASDNAIVTIPGGG